MEGGDGVDVFLKMSLIYAGRIAEGVPGRRFVEWAPEIHVFPSAHLVPPGTYQVIVRQAASAQSALMDANMSFTVPRRSLPLSPYAGIGFNAYVHSTNEDDLPTMETAGSAYLPLKTIMEDRQTTQTHTFRLCQSTDDDFCKGTLTVTLSVIKSHGLEALVFAKADDGDRDEAMRALNVRTLGCFYDLYAPLRPFIHAIHCPEFMTTRGPIPGSAYTLWTPPVPSEAAFFANIFRIALERNHLTEAAFVRVVTTQLASREPGILEDTFYDALRVISDMACTVETSEYYNSDKSNRNVKGRPFSAKNVREIEAYKDERVLWTDDCEGAARSTYITIWEFMRHTPPEGGALALVKRVLELYVPMMVLGAVTMASLGSNDSPGGVLASSLTEDQALAHIYAMLLPRAFVRKAMARCASLSTSGGGPPRFAGPTDPLPWEDKLEALIPEGTGVLEGTQKPPASYYKHASAYVKARASTIQLKDALAQTYPELKNLTSKIYQRHMSERELQGSDLSPFYKVPIAAYTSYFADQGAAFYDVAFVYPASRRYGVSFRDLVFMDPKVGIHICTDWTPGETAIVRDVLAQLEPTPPLEAPPPLSAKEHAAMQAMLWPLIKAYGGPQRVSAAREREHLNCLIYRIRQEELAGSGVVKTLLRAFTNRNMRLKAFDWAPRPIFTCMGRPPMVVVDLILYHV